MRKIYGILLAAGSGTRMGSELPKQFLRIKGKTVLQMSIERLLEAEADMKIITVLPKRYFELWKDICAEDSFDCPQILVEGGITRFQSVRNALAKVPDNALALIHDGVRPFVSVELIRSMIEKMADCPALIPVLPVTDTLRSIDGSVPDPDRSKTVAVQTPQVFYSEIIKKAYEQAYRLSFTDDASVVAAMGEKVHTIAGEKCNIKLTTPFDLKLGEFILSL